MKGSRRSRVLPGWPDALDDDLLGVGRGQDIAGGSFLLEMQFNAPHIELREHAFDPLFDGGVVGAIARDVLRDNGPVALPPSAVDGELAWSYWLGQC